MSTPNFIDLVTRIFCCLFIFAGLSSVNSSSSKVQATVVRRLARSEPSDSRTFRRPSNERLEQQQQQLREKQQQFRQQYRQEWNQQQQQWQNKRNQQQQQSREHIRQERERTYERIELQRQERLERQRKPLLIQPR